MIKFNNVWKAYKRSGYGVLACGELTIESGEIVGILGENGSGKTTMLKAIMGLTELQEGTILIDGKPVNEQYERLSFITEEGSFIPYQTPYEYAEFLQDFFPRFDFDRFKKLIKFFKLALHSKIRSFSKGQKAKLEISAGFSKGAKIILLDEPFLGNDLPTRQDFLKLMVASLDGDETILIATHLIDEIEQVIDRAIVLRYGQVKADVYIDDLRDEGKSLEALMKKISRYKANSYKEVM